MSTIKSSAEHLTLNADGSSKDIKFQANGVEKASISSAGAFTSTTIDATKLTGTIPNFRSTGIDDNANATAITINSAENVGIGTASPSYRLHVENSIDGDFAALIHNTDADNGQGLMIRAGADSGEAILSLRNQASSEKFKVLADGRGLSQFTAKAWANFNGTGAAIVDSHNIGSLTDVGVGNYKLNFTNAMSNTTYSVTGMTSAEDRLSQDGSALQTGFVQIFLIEGGTTSTRVDNDRSYIQIFGD